MRAGKWGILETVGAMLLLAIAFAVSYPIWRSAQPAAPKATCISNLKQLSTAVQIYLADFDDRFPRTGWADELFPYYKNADIHTCPTVRAEKGSSFGYAFHSTLLSAQLSKIGAPDKAVMFFETDALGRGVIANLAARTGERHKGRLVGSVVTYVETTTKFILKGTPP